MSLSHRENGTGVLEPSERPRHGNETRLRRMAQGTNDMVREIIVK